MTYKRLLIGSSISAILLAVALCLFLLRYQADSVMHIALSEVGQDEYLDDPAVRSPLYGEYSGRTLKLVQRDTTHFDFDFLPSNTSKAARVSIKNIDLSLFIPKVSSWAQESDDLEIISVVDREWNRQQVSFTPESEHIEIHGGDGFELDNIHSIHLARNCLNAGLWEILLFSQTAEGGKELYYQGWFDFPMGHYKTLFEHNNASSYWTHWLHLEHWFAPTESVVQLDFLRSVEQEKSVSVEDLSSEKILIAGEQLRKQKTVASATELLQWQDFYTAPEDIQFASFLPPGQYMLDKPRPNQYWEIKQFEQAVLRTIQPASGHSTLQELSLTFKDASSNKKLQFIVSGVDFSQLQQLAPEDYPQGLYMPMGINVPPFYQSYTELKAEPPYNSDYFSVLLDENQQWVDHHATGIDGPVMHLDKDDPSILHLYLLSYERHSLIRHFKIQLT